MNTLNDYCLLHIFQYFLPMEKLIIEQVCTRWKYLIEKLWRKILKLRFEDGYMFHKKTYKFISYDTLQALIHRCGKYIQHIDLENTIVMNKFLLVYLGSYTYILLVKNYTINDIIETIGNCCHKLETAFLNTHTVLPNHLKKLLEFNRNISNIKICGIDNKTVIDNYLQLLPSCLRKIDLFFIDCELKNGLYELIKRSSNLIDLKCICYDTNCDLGSTERILQATGNYAMYLNRLHLRQMDANVSEHSLHGICILCNLEYLKLEQFDNVLTDDIIKQIISNCKMLRFISFSGCPLFSNCGIHLILTTLLKLEELEIFHSNISELISANSTAIIPTMKRLYIVDCPNLNEDALCRILNISPNITTLFISQCSLKGVTVISAICTAISRNKTFIFKKWEALNAKPFRIIIKQVENHSFDYNTLNNNESMRLLVYNNEGFDDFNISTNTNIAAYLKEFVFNSLRNCQMLQ